jgi:hypothetical protein
MVGSERLTATATTANGYRDAHGPRILCVATACRAMPAPLHQQRVLQTLLLAQPAEGRAPLDGIHERRQLGP